ncbi:hypothetical protein F9K72_00530 [Brucella intermedia]|nr:hypothetical protein F9K72_00530 [Brucella intermedia]KAB2708898.1 hypothetical protein F9K80_13240 [Brucella intermedia]
MLEYLAIRNLRIHDRLSQNESISGLKCSIYLFLTHVSIPKNDSRFRGHAPTVPKHSRKPVSPAGLIQTAKQKGRPDNPSGLFPERKCTNACVAAFSGPTTNR